MVDQIESSTDIQQDGFLILTHVDTDVLAFHRIADTLDAEFSSVRVYNVSNLSEESDAIAFFDEAVPSARIVFLKLLGGRASLPGFDHLVRLIERNNQFLIAVPGTDDLDPELTAYSNAGVPLAHEAKAYLQLGGLENHKQFLYFLSDHLLATGFGYDAPAEQSRHGIYHPQVSDGSIESWRNRVDATKPTIGVLFYRSFLLTGNTSFVDTLVEVGEMAGANVLPVYAYSLKEPPEAGDDMPPALRYFLEDGKPTVDVIINTMSFAMGGSNPDEANSNEWSVDTMERLGVPQLQAVNAMTGSEQWMDSSNGLTPIDVAMNVAIPELDGRLVTVPISFKEPYQAKANGSNGIAGSPVLHNAANPERVTRVIKVALKFAALRRKPNSEKRIAVALTNHNAKASRIANAVGLDSPASLLHLLHVMGDAGYDVGELPDDSDSLLHQLIERGNYDRDLLTDEQLQNAVARVPASKYRQWFADMPESRQIEIVDQWDAPPGRYYVDDEGTLSLAGIRFGNVFVAVQPPRGYGMDPTAIMHKPDLPPTYPYHALYRWLAESQEDGGWGTDAVIHMGKHGSLEWLPGKGIGTSEECYPDMFLGDLPLIYPFIIDDPGEGAAAKRRTHATIVDHLPPPMTTADSYGPIEQLGRLVDEYYLLERTDPDKMPLLRQQIWAVIQESDLDKDLEAILAMDHEDDDDVDEDEEFFDPTLDETGVPKTIAELSGPEFADLVEDIHTYTHELTTAPIRDGLHILGKPPEDNRLIDTLMMLVRLPNENIPSLREGIAETYDLDISELLADPGKRFEDVPTALATRSDRQINAHADAIEAILDVGLGMLRDLMASDFDPKAVADVVTKTLIDGSNQTKVIETLSFVCGTIVPALRRTNEEIDHILLALNGGYIPPGPSGAPTRGMAHVLPTGRNFYSVDPRGLPSPTAWLVGEQLADGVIERYQREEGTFPESVGISIWGTSAMRTSGDDIAQVYALIGVKPRWQPESRRVIGVDVIPLKELGRPRVDVICRISGFFRDAFPHAIAIMDEAFDIVSQLDEPLDQNFVKRNRLNDEQKLVEQGVSKELAWKQAGYRIFGSKPGTYGAGVLQLIDQSQWRGDADFAETYVNWGGYAYTRETYGIDAREDFRRSLSGVQVALKNQDNREHDIFDSDDYMQFHGGMIATIRSITGRNPRPYFGDTQDPQRAKVRDLKDEAHRVFRSRVVNPKWIDAIKRHGYKGALEIAATVDYMFGYDATAQVVDDWMYEQVTNAYLLDPDMQEFFKQSNPWAAKDMAERLLEAIQRGMWENPDDEMRQKIEEAYLQMEGDIEGRG